MLILSKLKLATMVLAGGVAMMTTGAVQGAELAREEAATKQAWVRCHLVEAGDVPFSFTLAGRLSADFFTTARRQATTKKLDANRQQLVITWDDAKTGLRVRCEATEYLDLPAVDWVLYLSNQGTNDTPILDSVRALDMTLPGTTNGFVLHHSLGDDNSALSFRPIADVIAPDRKEAIVVAPTGGRSSQGNMPYFNLDAHGEGVAMAIGWTGQWQAEFQPASSNRLRVTAGQQTTHFKLLPGETIRTPRILLVFWKGARDIRGNNHLRQVVLRHYQPRRNGQIVLPPICTAINDTAKDGSYEEPHLQAMKPLAALGIEVFWSDMNPQHWYPGDFPNGTGNWTVDPKKYPHGLKPIGDAIHRAGMEFLLWYEPERVNYPGTQVDREHPEWLSKPWGPGPNAALFRLDIPAARQWLTDLMDRHMTEAGVDWARWDFNLDPLPYWKFCDAPDRQGITEAKHIEGLYAMWEDLRKRHPGLVIDICASGGRRLDIETAHYGIPLWHSDMQCSGKVNPTPDQLQNGALFRWVPLHACGDPALEPEYGFRSAMTGGGIFMPIVDGKATPTLPENEAGMKRTVALLKKIRPYTLGDFYPLFPHDTSEAVWYGYQFHLPAKNAGMAILFRRKDSPDVAHTVPLQDVDPRATYEVTFQDAPGTKKMSGAELAALRVEISTAPGSAILFYQLQ